MILAADIGGTNTRIALIQEKEYTIIEHVEEKTTTTAALLLALKGMVAKGRVAAVSLAMAGPKSEEGIQLTHGEISLRVDQVQQELGVAKVTLMNDFEAVGYATNILTPEDVHVVQQGEENPATRITIGAGTDLGKGILCPTARGFMPLSSEGAHADFPAQDSEEVQLLEAIRQEKGNTHVRWGDILSGEGVLRLYTHCNKDGPALSSPEEVFAQAGTNTAAQQALDLFSAYYGRACRNFIFEAAGWGGCYIAGGIAAGNPQLFNEQFLKEFHKTEQYAELLERVPIKIITSEAAILRGAAYGVGA